MRENRNEDLVKSLGVIFAGTNVTGRRHAISRDRLIGLMQIDHPTIDEREIREAIHELRKQGLPICSTGGFGGGYYRAADQDELEEYLDREIHSRATDLLETEAILRKACEMTWGPKQLELVL